MSWRTGADLFAEVWPLIRAKIPQKDDRLEFTAQLLRVFIEWDMDAYDVEDIDPEIQQALKTLGPWMGDEESAET